MNCFRLVMLKKRKKKKQNKTKRVQIDHFLPFHWYQFVLFLTAQLKFLHTVDLIGQKAVQMIILASSSGGTVVAVNKTDDTVFVKVSPLTGMER